MINIRHIGIYVDNLEKIANFYMKSFGMICITKNKQSDSILEELLKKEHVQIEIRKLITECGVKNKKGDMIELIKVLNKPTNKMKFDREIDIIGMNHIAFGITNIEKTVNTVIENGGVQITDIHTIANNKCCFVKDIEGNWIELIENM